MLIFQNFPINYFKNLYKFFTSMSNQVSVYRERREATPVQQALMTTHVRRKFGWTAY